jgi:hypothetical protein
VRIKASETWLVKGRLTQKGRAFKSLIGKQIQYVAVFECECGKKIVVSHGSVSNGHTRSCGCVRKGLSNEKVKKHGHSVSVDGKTKTTKTYRTWTNMRNRCGNPRCKYFKDYGGRGIIVCERWNSFESFLQDVGEIPEGLTIDRVDNNKGYCPENVRLATMEQQANNTRATRFLTINGVTKSISEWAKQTGAVSPSLIHSRLSRGHSEYDSVFAEKGVKRI